MVDVERYKSSNVPSLSSASSSESNDLDDTDNLGRSTSEGKKKRRKKKHKAKAARRVRGSKVIVTSTIVVNCAKFTSKDLSEFTESFGRSQRMTAQTHAKEWVHCSLLLHFARPNTERSR